LRLQAGHSNPTWEIEKPLVLGKKEKKKRVTLPTD
jgi:hypothetical protein